MRLAAADVALDAAYPHGYIREWASFCASVGDGVFELRIHAWPGYRVYYWRQGAVTYWLLCGGDKSTQRRDITKAKLLRTRVENEP